MLIIEFLRRVVTMSSKEPIKPKILHIMADGTILKSIEGIVIPVTSDTYPLYKAVADMVMKNKLLVQRKEKTA